MYKIKKLSLLFHWFWCNRERWVEKFINIANIKEELREHLSISHEVTTIEVFWRLKLLSNLKQRYLLSNGTYSRLFLCKLLNERRAMRLDLYWMLREKQHIQLTEKHLQMALSYFFTLLGNGEVLILLDSMLVLVLIILKIPLS